MTRLAHDLPTHARSAAGLGGVAQASLARPAREEGRADRVATGRDDRHAPVPPRDAPPAESASSRFERVRLADVAVHAATHDQVVATILAELDAGRGGAVITPNLDHLVRARKHLDFRAMVWDFDLAVADGMPLVWASRLRGTPLPERVAGSDLIHSVTAAAAEAGRSIFLLGGDPGTAEGSARILQARHRDLAVAGTYCPERGFEENSVRYSQMVDALRSARPDIVFVALGSPKQERLICQLRETLPQTWWLGIGISFSFVTEHVSRAPQWMRRSGLEWVHRLLQEPLRLGRRYLVDGVPFAVRLLARSAGEGLLRRPAPAIPPPGARRVNGNGTLLARLAEASPSAASGPARIERRTGSDDGSTRVLDTATAAARSGGVPGAHASHGTDGEATTARAALSRLREVILLAGQSLPSRLAVATGRPVLELPLCRRPADDPQAPGAMERLLDGWLRWRGGLAAEADLSELPIRLVVSQHLPGQPPVPSLETPRGGVPRPSDVLRLETDRSPHRGTGGLLHDLVEGADDDDLVLVCTARQVLIDPLSVLVRILAGRIARGADAALVAHADGTPAGITLLRCGVLHAIKASGYVDLKQQALPELSRRFDVRAVQMRRATGLPVFGGPSYVRALSRYHAARDGRGHEPPPLGVPLAEDFDCHFALVEEGAEVARSARLHDSVVLAGGRVEAGARVINSVVADGAVVRRDRQVMNELVT